MRVPSTPSSTQPGGNLGSGSQLSQLFFRKKAMSAVSSESPLAAADLSAPSAHSSSQTHHPESAEPGAAPGAADFGANEWLVDELYERYLNDPGSVDKAWWSFFADYRPVRSVNGTGPQPVLAEARAAPSAPAAARSRSRCPGRAGSRRRKTTRPCRQNRDRRGTAGTGHRPATHWRRSPRCPARHPGPLARRAGSVTRGVLRAR